MNNHLRDLDLSSHRHSHLEWLAQGHDPFEIAEELEEERLRRQADSPMVGADGAFAPPFHGSIAEDPHFAENFGDLRGEKFILYLQGMQVLALKLSLKL